MNRCKSLNRLAGESYLPLRQFTSEEKIAGKASFGELPHSKHMTHHRVILTAGRNSATSFEVRL